MKRSALLVVFVVMAIVLATVAYAMADPVTYPGTLNGNGKWQSTSGPGAVIVTATIGPKIALTVITPDAAQTDNFGLVTPTAGPYTKTNQIVVQSNKAYDVGSTQDNGTIWTTSGMNYSRSFNATLLAQAKPAASSGTTFTDNVVINPDYTVSPGTYNGIVWYTAIQN